jgi:hypothetical protein
VITLTQVTNITLEGDPNTLIGFSQVFSGGMGIISDTVGYTETHRIHVIAYDAAGNMVETEPIIISVVHEEEDEEESQESGALPGPLSEPVAIRSDWYMPRLIRLS